MHDLISRWAAIDALDRAAECWNIAEPFNEGMRAGYKAAVTIVLSLPSAQPVDKDIDVPSTDTISRAAALDALGEKPLAWMESEYAQGLQNQWVWDVNALKALPSAQPKTYREGYQTGFKDAQPEPCKDAVSRSRVKLLLARLRDAVDDGYGFSYQSAVDELRDMPPAQPERKTGKWKKISPASIYECSVCGQNIMTQDIDAYRYCHGCGAEMEVSE